MSNCDCGSSAVVGFIVDGKSVCGFCKTHGVLSNPEREITSCNGFLDGHHNFVGHGACTCYGDNLMRVGAENKKAEILAWLRGHPAGVSPLHADVAAQLIERKL